MALYLLNTAPRVVRNPRFWLLVGLFVVGIILHYPQQLPFLGSEAPSSLLGLTQHTIERVYLLVPVIYAGFIFGLKGGIASLVVAFSIMLPRVILISPSPTDASIETAGVMSIGIVVNLLFQMRRREQECIRVRGALLKTEEEKWRSSFNALEDVMLIIDRDYSIENINDSGLALLGKSREEVIGKKCHEIISRPDCRSRECPCRRALETKQVETVERYEEWLNRYFSIKCSPILDENGEVIKFVDLIRDITVQKRAEEALEESERSYRGLFEAAPDAIWVHDLKGNILKANKATEKLTGFSAKELARVNVKTLLSEEGLRLAKEVRRRLVRGEAVAQPYEQHLVRKDGTEAPLMLTTTPIFGNGQLMAFQNIARDITEEKRMQENLRFYLREIARAQEEERKRVARELHDSTAQTLIALLHQLENLMNDKAKLPVREARALRGFYEQIRDVLGEVRRFSRNLRPSVLDDLGLLPALEWVTGEFKKEYGVETTFKVVGSERRFSEEAELILFRIVQEALRNIAKHAQASKAEVKVEFEKQKILVTISDDGVGFEPQKSLEELLHWGKFGLAGMQERVQLLGGNLKVKSKVGKGTTIVATAPI